MGFLVFLGSGLGRDVAKVPSPFIGKPLPAFAAPVLGADPAGVNQQAQRELLGQVWLLNVWASWCAPCREEHPLLVDYQRQPGAVRVVGLNYKDKPAAASAWLAQLGDPYAMSLVDADGRLGIELGGVRRARDLRHRQARPGALQARGCAHGRGDAARDPAAGEGARWLTRSCRPPTRPPRRA